MKFKILGASVAHRVSTFGLHVFVVWATGYARGTDVDPSCSNGGSDGP